MNGKTLPKTKSINSQSRLFCLIRDFCLLLILCGNLLLMIFTLSHLPSRPRVSRQLSALTQNSSTMWIAPEYQSRQDSQVKQKSFICEPNSYNNKVLSLLCYRTLQKKSKKRSLEKLTLTTIYPSLEKMKDFT